MYEAWFVLAKLRRFEGPEKHWTIRPQVLDPGEAYLGCSERRQGGSFPTCTSDPSLSFPNEAPYAAYPIEVDPKPPKPPKPLKS